MDKRRTALITGASRGIGKAIALELAEKGCDIGINYLPDTEDKNLKDAEAVKKEIEVLGRKALLLAADVSDEKQVARMAQEYIAWFKRIDILINNAGVLMDKTLKKMDPQTWNKVIAVNLGSVYNCCHAVIDHMIEQNSGRIINISSVVAFTGNFGQTNYAAGKAGVVGFTKSLAREVALKGITVNAIAPGIIDTDMMSSVPAVHREELIKKIPMGKMGSPKDIAHTAAFIAGDEAGYITGQVFHVNGGYYM